MELDRRHIELVVLSDLHLGTYGSKAKQVGKYLKSIKPEVLVLNGDIVDIWQFSKNYWPTSHMKVLKQLVKLMVDGTKVVYIPGNHDETMRKFVGTEMGNLSITNQWVTELDGQKTWVFHGDVLDTTMQHAKWIAKLGAKAYGFLILLNRLINAVLKLIGCTPYPLSKKLKEKAKKGRKAKATFEQALLEMAKANGYQAVICGHLHQAEIRKIQDKEGFAVQYLNSGDWVESLTALEYHAGTWELFEYQEPPEAALRPAHETVEDLSDQVLSGKELFASLMQEFSIAKA